MFPKAAHPRNAPLLAAIVWSLGVGAAPADVFVLTSGGRIEGEWLNRDEQPHKEYLVRTPSGLTASLQLTQVREIVRRSQLDDEYARRAAAVADTVDAQWQLAEWCRQQQLPDQRKIHLRQIVQLSPDHQQARRALGFQFLDGQWITKADFRRSEGYEFYKGKWRTPQEIEILEQRARLELAQKDWLLKLRRYRNDLDSPERARQGYAALIAIKDPIAVGPLAEMFVRERARRVKMLYADVLANIGAENAVAVLVDRVLHDPDEELFHYCLERLLDLQPPHLADPFIRELKSPANGQVNRAATALAQIREPSAIAPLIEALVTTHTRVLPGRAGVSPDATTATFSDSGPAIKQGEAPHVQIVHVRNQHVLDALTRLTGANFDFDKKSWHSWHAQEKKAQEAAQPLADTRRQ